MKRLHTEPTKTKRGYTLVEIMMTVLVLVIVGAMVTPFLFEHIKSSYVSEQRNSINKEIRMITNEMSDNARSANYFVMYPSFAAEDRDNIADRLNDGQKGNLLVLVHQTPVEDTSLSTRPIERIVGYYKESGIAPIMKFDIMFNPASSAAVETLIPAESASSGFTKIVDLVEGRADGKLFYNFRNKSVMINGKIFHGNTIKTVTDTYNFTVSPRG